MTILRILACLTIALCTVLALLRLEGLPPEEADALVPLQLIACC